ncbi:MAG: hypothetical protein WDA22_14595 [Bacteroidota bacterium]
MDDAFFPIARDPEHRAKNKGFAQDGGGALLNCHTERSEVSEVIRSDSPPSADKFGRPQKQDSVRTTRGIEYG